MNKDIKKQAEAFAASLQEEQLALLKILGRIPSPSRHEDLRAAFIKDWFQTAGAQDVSIDEMKNVIVKIGCAEDSELIVFAAHTDIVFPDTETLPMTEDENTLHAPGIGDDTSNLVNLMLCTRYLIQNKTPMRHGILIVANSCEEGLGNSDGVKAIFEKYGARIKYFYSFDGYISQCTSSAVGSYRYRISCKTTGGHSYLDYGHANAIEILCGLVEDLYRIEPPTEVKTTYNVGRFEGGSTVNSIAQSASILYEFRSTSQHCLETMEQGFQAAVERAKSRGGDLTVELLGVRPGNGPLDKDALQIFTAQSADIIQSFYDGEMDYGAYSTDSNVPLSVGILANTIGTVSGRLAHTREEWIDKHSLPTGLKIAFSTIMQYAV